MNEPLTELALEFGWGCPRCNGTGKCQVCDGDGAVFEHGVAIDYCRACRKGECPACHGNRVTPSDAEEFERLVVKVVQAALPFQKYAERGPMDLFAALDSLQRKADG